MQVTDPCAVNGNRKLIRRRPRSGQYSVAVHMHARDAPTTLESQGWQYRHSPSIQPRPVRCPCRLGRKHIGTHDYV